MSQSYQLTIEDMERQEYIDAQPKRIAYIDECGSFGFDSPPMVRPSFIFYVLS